MYFNNTLMNNKLKLIISNKYDSCDKKKKNYNQIILLKDTN